MDFRFHASIRLALLKIKKIIKEFSKTIIKAKKTSYSMHGSKNKTLAIRPGSQKDGF